MNQDNVLYFVIAIILTIFIEFIVYSLSERKNFLKLFLYSILITLATWPIANLIFGFGVNLWIVEFFVFVGEIFLIKPLFEIGWIRAIIVSLIANSISFFAGVYFRLI